MLLPETDREGAEKVGTRILEAWCRADIAALLLALLRGGGCTSPGVPRRFWA